jgi:hypothetical protein
MDNLNTHTVSSLYETFPAAEAFEIARKLEIHYTPKHGSWLNIAEIELSAMTSQCLDRRIDTLEKLQGELGIWQRERNQNQKTVKWQFTTEDARIKLHGLYPAFCPINLLVQRPAGCNQAVNGGKSFLRPIIAYNCVTALFRRQAVIVRCVFYGHPARFAVYVFESGIGQHGRSDNPAQFAIRIFTGQHIRYFGIGFVS